MNPIIPITIAGWHELFKQRTAPLAGYTLNQTFVKEALALINQTKPGPSSERSSLFELHAHLFVLGLLLNRMSIQVSQHGTFIGYQTHAAISDVKKAIAHILENKYDDASSPAYREHLTDTLDYLRELMLTEAGNKLHYSDLYFQLWSCWIVSDRLDSSLCEVELKLLLSAPDELGQKLFRYPWLLAQSWICFFLRRDEEALAHLKEIGGSFAIRPEDLFPQLSMMLKDGEWQRLAEWLAAAAPLMERQQLQSLERFYQYWDHVISHIPQAEEPMWASLARMQSYTGSIYEDNLLRYAKWQKWIDYQISTGSEPLDYRVSVLAPIEKEAPELLLPFYHQAAERYVLLKNRDGYKAAVKLLKRLAKLYKKTKNEERWESYISAFASRNSRLRALQEELRKGKLIP